VIVRGLLIALAVVIAWAGFQTVRAGRLKAEAVALRAENSTLEREATGQAEIATATETFHTRETVIREVQSQADREARSAPDAETPLPDERLARHLRNDERVCDGASFTCATLDAPLGGVGAVPTDDATG
jgi:Tfp pilus assembly protein PilN